MRKQVFPRFSRPLSPGVIIGPRPSAVLRNDDSEAVLLVDILYPYDPLLVEGIARGILDGSLPLGSTGLMKLKCKINVSVVYLKSLSNSLLQ